MSSPIIGNGRLFFSLFPPTSHKLTHEALTFFYWHVYPAQLPGLSCGDWTALRHGRMIRGLAPRCQRHSYHLHHVGVNTGLDQYGVKPDWSASWVLRAWGSCSASAASGSAICFQAYLRLDTTTAAIGGFPSWLSLFLSLATAKIMSFSLFFSLNLTESVSSSESSFPPNPLSFNAYPTFPPRPWRGVSTA